MLNPPPYVVYIAQSPEAFGIAPGSALVSMPTHEGQSDVLVYYEGNLYGSAEMRSFERRAFHAASRLGEKYPTVAKAFLPLDQLRVVGRFEGTDLRDLTYVDMVDPSTYDPEYASLLQELKRKFPRADLLSAGRTQPRIEKAFKHRFPGQRIHAEPWSVIDPDAITAENVLGFRSGGGSRESALRAALAA